ncbi:hypothetical protein [Taibaiella koreensis]|uniref:hypothetical protein n=1 Tax=Taibaiella koreensis TaxID=1268548 RepID=UPI0013C32182|nr:hypothetical protein [Taibaiella koreensis]
MKKKKIELGKKLILTKDQIVDLSKKTHTMGGGDSAAIHCASSPAGESCAANCPTLLDSLVVANCGPKPFTYHPGQICQSPASNDCKPLSDACLNTYTCIYCVAGN